MLTPRVRFTLTVAGTLLLLSAAIGFMIVRAREWHRRGWAGVYFISGPEAQQQARMMGLRDGEVMSIAAGSPADKRLLFRDEVLSINGIPRQDTARLRALDAKSVRGDSLVYRVRRGGKIIDVPLRLASPLRSRMILISHVVALLVGLTFLGIALVVIVRAPSDRRALVFFALALVSSLSIITTAAMIYEQSQLRGIATGSSSSIASTFLMITLALFYPPLILHLAMIFPRNRPIVDKYPVVIRWIYAVALPTILTLAFLGAIGVTVASGIDPKQGRIDTAVTFTIRGIVVAGFVLALYLLFAARKDGIRAAIVRRPFISTTAAIGLLFGLGKSLSGFVPKVVAVIVAMSAILLPCLILLSFPILACVALVRSYRSSNVEEKRQVAWPLWGLVIAITGKILGYVITLGTLAYITITHRDFIAWRGFFEIVGTLPTIITLAIPIAFAVAILKYRLMNIDVIIRKTVAYAILSGAIIVLYLGLVGGLGTLLVNVAGVRDQTMVIVSTLLVALIVVPLRNRLQTLVDRNLFRHKYDYPAALRAISAETLTATDSGAFLSSAAEKMQQALQNRAVVIFTIRYDEFVAIAKVGVADTLVGTLRFAKEWMLPHLDRALDPRQHELPVAAAAALRTIGAVLVVPINTPGTPPNGFVALAAKLNDAPFEVEDLDFVRSVADQLDLGIDRIHSQREEADFAQARAIQQTLLPREMPRVAKLDVSGIWQPARTMGGDYYDFIPLSETELAVCIGDVAGKGMTAALLMSGLQAAVRASASSSPRDLCERVRRVVVSSLSGGRFVTFFYATLDTANMRLRWCNAGHNAPILARADGTIVRLAEGGPALSRLMRDAAFSEEEIDLRPGDRIVLFTDGVSEAADSSGEMFDERRIEELVADSEGLAAAELQETILDAATTHSGGELADDLTLVVLRVAE